MSVNVTDHPSGTYSARPSAMCIRSTIQPEKRLIVHVGNPELAVSEFFERRITYRKGYRKFHWGCESIRCTVGDTTVPGAMASHTRANCFLQTPPYRQMGLSSSHSRLTNNPKHP
jgi:hypothetical protein